MRRAENFGAIKELIKNDLLGYARRMEDYVINRYRELDERFGIVNEIRGKGLMVAFQFVCDKKETIFYRD
jgi:4-aminobutyrate aminotransferase-like enzyme